MKRIVLAALMILIQVLSFGQSESEPNNEFGTANVLTAGNWRNANLGAGDTLDYHSLYLHSNANFFVYLEITNTAASGVGNLQLNVFNTLRINDEYVGNIYSTGYNVNAGDTFYDTLFLCGKAVDSFYLQFESQDEFDYYMRWFVVNSYPNDGSNNNTFATASPFVFEVEDTGSIRYEFWGGSNFDTVDYFTSVLPAGPYDSVVLNLRAKNNSCTDGQWIKYFCYRNNSSGLFAAGFIGDDPTVNAYQEVSSNIPLNMMAAGDTLIIRFSADVAFGYRFKYYKTGEFDPDPEDNCCIYNAIPLAEMEIRSGNVGELDYNVNEYIDEYDTYRIIFPQDGAIRLFVRSRNDQCTESDDYLFGEILDTYGNTLAGTVLANWPGMVSCGQLQYDTIKLRGFAADTFYLRLESVEQVSYIIKYQFLDQTIGDSAESYNSPISTVIPIAAGQVRKGHVRFRKAIGQADASDIYGFNMPGDGSITVYMKAIYRGDIMGTNSSTANRLTFVTANFTDRIPSNPPTTTLVPDAVYLDTFVVCGLGAGNNYFTISSSRAYEYEVHYVVNGTQTVQNDPEPNNFFLHAIPIVPNEIRSGRLRYFNDIQGSSQDNFDYYKTTTAHRGRLKVYIQATNTTCTTAARITLNMYKDTISAGLVASRNLTNTTSIPAGTTVYDTVYTCRFNADTAYLRLEGTQTFRYQFRFEFLVDTTAEIDPEPDNSFSEAIRIGSGQNHLRYLGKVYTPGTDVNDYVKMIVPGPDSLKLRWQISNIGCVDNRYFRIYGYNKNHNLIFFKGYILDAVGILDAGQVVEGNLVEPIAALDTVYIRFEANGFFRYYFQTDPVIPSNWFKISGDSTACTGGTYTYRVSNLVDSNVTFHWSLPLGGGTLTAQDSIATVVWNTNGNRSIQLYISNSRGSSPPVTQNIVVNGEFPTQTPVAYNFARTLSTNSLPQGANSQWYRNDTLIAGATDSSYYAAAAGNYTVKFVNDCGPGPSSNVITFTGPAQPQTITFPHIPTISMSPTARTTLQATASSALPVFYQKISGPGNIVNDTLFVTGVGTIIVKASQPGDDVYSAAATVNDTITVIKGNQTITFDSIPPQIFDANKITLTAVSSMAQSISYSIVAGSTYASVSGNKITKKGAGTVTVRASQNGNANYNPATPVDRTFCIGVRTLTSIIGEASPCIATYTYRTQKIPGAIFVWTLSGGGILTTNNDTAWVQWQTPGTYTLTVKANSPCDTIYTNLQSSTITTSNNPPGAVSNLLPADNSINQQLPLTLSWIPGNNTVNYDLYLWDSAATEPLTPYAANISDIQYIIPKNSGLPYHRPYKWKVVAKNPCWQTTGPIQQFRLIPLPDLVVSDVQAPATATSGQTISISWKVTNVGPGRTGANATWYDGVYFAMDTLPNLSFATGANWNASSWNTLTASERPLLLGKKIRPSSLDSGQFYINTLNFTLPLEYSFPVYVYVITDNEHPNWKVLQVSVANDTARKQNPINISLAPTPDFRVDTVFSPASTFSGSTIGLTYKVKNYGVVTPAGANWTDSVFISQNPLFDRNSAIPINLPKYNGSYYPNAVEATSFNNTQLLPDSTYTKNLQVVIPNFIFGTWFIYVKANAKIQTNTFVYEGALNNNNINRSQIQIYLTPTPKLTVNTLSVPVASASTTQPIGVNWNVKNEGFKDNIEKNRGHYLTIGWCGRPCGHGSICTYPYVLEDSVTFGGSYWLDRVYLSTDSTGLNINNAVLVKDTSHGKLNSGLYQDVFYPGGCGIVIPTQSRINIDNIIEPGSDFPLSANFAIPSHLQPGNYYIYVYTNPTKTVFEYPGTAQIKRSALPITVARPDATVPSVTVPSNVSGGQQLTINYNVLNNGPGVVFNHIRSDRIYVSNFSSFDGSALLIDTKTYTEDLPVGTAIPHSLTYAFPAATSGAKYFYVIANYDSAFRETNSLNNLSAAAMTTVSAALPADLVVSNIQMPDTTFAVFTQFLTYTVTNNGSGTTAGTWTDSVYFSCSPSFNFSTNNFVAKKIQTRAVPPGGSYTDTIHMTLPKMSYEYNSCFPQTANQNAYFYIKTNSGLSIYEGNAINNNVTGTGSRIFTNPLVDHIVTTVSAPDTTTVGFVYPVSWRVKNIGYNPNKIQYYYSWYDAIYFSADSIADAADVRAGEYLKYLRINRGQDSADSRSPYTPVLLTGDYYVYVKTNSHGGINAEKVVSNNVNFIRNASGSAKKIYVIRPALADLTDSILTAPVSVATGQPITVIYKITNIGTGLTYPGSSLRNQLLLSEDFTALTNDGDRLLAIRTRFGAMPPGQFYYDTVTVTIPASTIPGNYVLISEANFNNVIMESNSNNNLGFSLLSVFSPPVTDLIVDNILKPDTVYLGYTMDTAKWVIKNTSAEEARGYSSDGIYLSSGSLFDSTAVLIGVKNKNIYIQPLQSDTVRMAPMVTGVVEGNYNVFVKTDLLNNIVETDKDNNTGMSATPIYVKVKELLLNVPEANTLHKISRYYKLIIPDSLFGSTILVTLKSNDSLTMKNEMFIGGGFVPTAAHYDYRFEIPNYGNQQIVMTSVTDSVYYIHVRCVTPNPLVQNITLKAVKLPFAILNVHTNSGGNIGNVTVKISGSLYRDSMTATLTKSGTTINASAVYYTNSTIVYATFNLQGKPLGTYDVTLMKPDSSTAVLVNGFSVVPANNGGLITGGGVNTGAGNGNEPGCDPGAASGLNSQLVVQLVVPSRVLIKRPVVILINYSNPTNFDIPAQSRILYSEAGIKMAFTRAGIPMGTTALYLELVEPGGPPGIIRAGGSGTIIVHCNAPDFVPQPNKFVLFKLK